MEFTVDWTVSGTSTVEIEWSEFVEAGINEEDYPDDKALFEALDKHYQFDLSNELVSDFDERQRVEIDQVLASGRLDGYDGNEGED